MGTLSPELLDDLTGASTRTKQQIFKDNVSLVEIETHARCNRICSFCPNVVTDRRRNYRLADAEMLDRVFDELGSIDYAAQLKVARYSEPLANADYLYDRLASARARIPRAQLAIVTNTDYLTPDALARLREVGCDVVYMSIYLKKNEPWSPEVAEEYVRRLSAKLDAPVVSRESTATSLRCIYQCDGLSLRSSCHNWDEYGTDRGATLSQYSVHERVGPCREPFQTFVVDYNGSVMPCCAVRSDIDDQAGLVVGDLSDPSLSIFDVYAGRLAAWRQSLTGFGSKAFPCSTCSHRELDPALVPDIEARVQARLIKIGRAQDVGAPGAAR